MAGIATMHLPVTISFEVKDISNEALDILYGGQDRRIFCDLIRDRDFDMDEFAVLEEWVFEVDE